MTRIRFIAAVAAAAVAATSAAPASAQFYFKAKDLRGEPVAGDEPGIMQPMPGATREELRAGLAWNMRAGLNVAALQCQFEPMLLTVANYNAILADHREELQKSFDTLGKYFNRTKGSAKAGQTALDQFGTRTYASFAAVASQYNFCMTAGEIGRDAIARPRGSFGDLSFQRMRELRNSLTPWGEQYFGGLRPVATAPSLEKNCWSGTRYNERKCGAWTN